ncbi:MAG: hypothetical protein EBX52_04610 [Proteobacteria bacterium]|nr:hypothetical protein [Pseudomonadota bacterium]
MRDSGNLVILLTLLIGIAAPSAFGMDCKKPDGTTRSDGTYTRAFDRAYIETLIRECKIRSADGLIDYLPKDVIKSVSLAHKSDSDEKSQINAMNPRVFFTNYSSSPLLVFAFPSKSPENISFMEFDEKANSFSFSRTDLRHPDGAATARTSKSCTSCHGGDPKPLFREGTFGDWPGFYNNPGASSKDKKQFDAFKKAKKNDPLFSKLDLEHLENPSSMIYSLSTRMLGRSLRKLKNRPAYAEKKYDFAFEALACSGQPLGESESLMKFFRSDLEQILTQEELTLAESNLPREIFRDLAVSDESFFKAVSPPESNPSWVANDLRDKDPETTRRACQWLSKKTNRPCKSERKTMPTTGQSVTDQTILAPLAKEVPLKAVPFNACIQCHGVGIGPPIDFTNPKQISQNASLIRARLDGTHPDPMPPGSSSLEREGYLKELESVLKTSH